MCVEFVPSLSAVWLRRGGGNRVFVGNENPPRDWDLSQVCHAAWGTNGIMKLAVAPGITSFVSCALKSRTRRNVHIKMHSNPLDLSTSPVPTCTAQKSNE